MKIFMYTIYIIYGTSPSGNLMDESGFGSCQENCTDSIVSSVKFGVPTWPCTSAQSKVHKDMEERVWCGWTWLACIDFLPQPNRTPLGWIRAETESQAFLSNITVWPHKCASGRMIKSSHKHTPKPCGNPFPVSWSCYSCKGWTNVILNPMD